MSKRESSEERSAREGGENELAGSRSAQQARGIMRNMDRQGRKETRKAARKPQR